MTDEEGNKNVDEKLKKVYCSTGESSERNQFCTAVRRNQIYQ